MTAFAAEPAVKEVDAQYSQHLDELVAELRRLPELLRDREADLDALKFQLNALRDRNAESANRFLDVIILLGRLERPRGAQRWVLEDVTERLSRLADELVEPDDIGF
jgi:hypothetical protein